jgi:hypothetical protein
MNISKRLHIHPNVLDAENAVRSAGACGKTLDGQVFRRIPKVTRNV